MRIQRSRRTFFQNKEQSLRPCLVCTRLPSSVLLVNDSREARHIKHTLFLSLFFFTVLSASEGDFPTRRAIALRNAFVFRLYTVIMAELKFKLAYRSG